MMDYIFKPAGTTYVDDQPRSFKNLMISDTGLFMERMQLQNLQTINTLVIKPGGSLSIPNGASYHSLEQGPDGVTIHGLVSALLI